MLNIVDLFSGAGGLTEGFRDESEINFLAHVEMNHDACMTLRLREVYYFLKYNNKLFLYYDFLKGNINIDDLFDIIPKSITKKIIEKEISPNNISNIFDRIDDIVGAKKVNGIIGGPPCQAYSTIGRANNKSKKHSDIRIYLYKQYIAFLIRYSPDFFIFENVPGLLSFRDTNNELLFPKIIQELKSAKHRDNYNVDFKLLDCSLFGVPQKRKRLIIFGYKSSYPKFDFFKHLDEFLDSSPTVNQVFYDLPNIHSGITNNNYSSKEPTNFVKKFIREKECILSQNICRRNNQRDLEIYRIVAEAKHDNVNLKYSDLPSYLISHKSTDSFLDRYKAIDGNGVSHTIVAHIAKDGHYYIHPDVLQNRSITLREAARIQTFPDNYYFLNSRTAAFTQIGNAVPPLFANKLCKNIIYNFYKLKK